jgi:hypothetical protein
MIIIFCSFVLYVFCDLHANFGCPKKGHKLQHFHALMVWLLVGFSTIVDENNSWRCFLGIYGCVVCIYWALPPLSLHQVCVIKMLPRGVIICIVEHLSHKVIVNASLVVHTTCTVTPQLYTLILYNFLDLFFLGQCWFLNIFCRIYGRKWEI